MALFFLEFENYTINTKQIQSIKKHIHYDTEKQGMSYDIVINDGLNEIFNTRYCFQFESEAMMNHRYKVLLDKLKIIDWIVFL